MLTGLATYTLGVNFDVMACLGTDRRRSRTRLGWLYNCLRSSQVHEWRFTFFRDGSKSQKTNKRRHLFKKFRILIHPYFFRLYPSLLCIAIYIRYIDDLQINCYLIIDYSQSINIYSYYIFFHIIYRNMKI